MCNDSISLPSFLPSFLCPSVQFRCRPATADRDRAQKRQRIPHLNPKLEAQAWMPILTRACRLWLRLPSRGGREGTPRTRGYHVYLRVGLLIHSPHLLVRVTSERFLSAWGIFRVILASESHWLQPVLVFSVHWWPTRVSVGGLLGYGEDAHRLM